MTTHPRSWMVWIPLFVALLPGCVHKMVANMTGSIFHRASPALEGQDDYAFAGEAMPMAVVQIDGLLEVVPDNETLLIDAAKGYAGYALGFIEDEAEAAEDRGDLEENDRQRARARAMYLRARERALHWLRLRDDGIDRAIARGPDELERYLRRAFTYKKDAPGLFWAGFAWGLAINVSLDDASMVADLALARALVERSVALDDDYYFASGLSFLGYADSLIAEAVGGHPERGREFFERALTKTNRHVFIVQFFYARSYAVQTQNRELYEQLLREVIDGEASDPDARLLNAIAKRRAARWMARGSQLF
ncbi:MAG: TRAP transporter TatT component family protein [Polyangiales bacterium]